MEKQNIIDGIRLIVIIGVFIFMVIGSYRNIINQNKAISTNNYIDKDNEIVNSNLEKEEVTDIEDKYYEDISKEDIDEYKDIKAIYPIHMNPLVREIAEDIFGVSVS